MVFNLPKDAEGKVIPFDTEHLYTKNGTEQNVESITFDRNQNKWIVETEYSFCSPDNFYLDKPDSLKQLTKDLDRMISSRNGYVCAYYHGCGGDDCSNCKNPVSNPDYSVWSFARDVARRVHRLAGDAE